MRATLIVASRRTCAPVSRRLLASMQARKGEGGSAARCPSERRRARRDVDALIGVHRHLRRRRHPGPIDQGQGLVGALDLMLQGEFDGGGERGRAAPLHHRAEALAKADRPPAAPLSDAERDAMWTR
jgi:hypothetical protein